MSKYQITLTPVDKFFFGGDMTFRVGNDKDEFNERYSSYIIQSSMFPQQTSLLGMLRFLLLKNGGDAVFKNGRIVNNQLAQELIGKRSFSVNSGHDENQFGKIKSLSHVWIRKTINGQSEDLEFEPFFRELRFTDETGFYNQNGISIPNLPKEDFDPKVGLKTRLTGFVELKDVFKEDRRIGIDRDIKTGKTGEKGDHALFKQISYRFATKVENDNDENKKEDVRYCFVFNAEVDDDVTLEKYRGQLVVVGGDNSQFVIDISKEEKKLDKSKPIQNAVYLLSPTFLSPEDAQIASFAVTELIPFRFLEAEVDKDVSYNIINKKEKKSLKRSDKYELYAPGSVFYFKDEGQKQKFIECIESKKEFRQIGYNEYK